MLSARERIMILLDFGTGLRRGELRGVKWEDIDFQEGFLTPKRSIVQQHEGNVKTEASKKPIPLDEDLIAELLAWRKETPYAADSDFVLRAPRRTASSPTGCRKSCSSTSSLLLQNSSFR
jgi:integrase